MSSVRGSRYVAAPGEARVMSAREALDVRVRLLPEPCLWCWEIVDRGGRLIRSSWAAEWTAYESREEALVAGRARRAAIEVNDSSTPTVFTAGKEQALR
jgi:hypothetical protein